jgi:hypothetical protein
VGEAQQQIADRPDAGFRGGFGQLGTDTLQSLQ